nr:PEP-CTERM sorting domain-containing protein [Opitutaceae bacterium]
GVAGTGYDTLAITGTLDLSALTGASKFNINLWSLSGTGPDVNGAAINFDNAQNYSWVLASTTGGVTGFSSADFQINVAALNGTAGFSNALNSGTFELGVVGNDLVLNYAAAIPEPSAFAALAGVAALGFVGGRRRRRVV